MENCKIVTPIIPSTPGTHDINKTDFQKIGTPIIPNTLCTNNLNKAYLKKRRNEYFASGAFNPYQI